MKKLLIVGSFLLLILLISGITFTWFKWRSSNNIGVSITIDNTSGLTITYNGGENITGNLEPTLTKEEGIVKTFSIYTSGLKVPVKFWLKINSLPSELKNETFKWTLTNNGTIMSGDFSTASIILNTNNGDNDYYLTSAYIDGNISNYTLYLWIDGTVDNNPNMASKSFDFDLYATSTIENTNSNQVTAANYISSLYLNAQKEAFDNNNIQYNFAPSVNLMCDRFGGTADSFDEGNIRYYGASPQNYIWLGDTYQTSYSYPGVTGTVTRAAGSKKLWRIVGVFDGRLKLISADPIASQIMSLDTSSDDVNGGKGISQWGPSGTYEGADLMKLLNPGYETNQDLDINGNTITVNNSLYWNKGTGTVYTAYSNGTTSNVSFANTGLSAAEKNLIDTATWYLSATRPSAFANQVYLNERSETLPCTSCTDNVERIATWEGKVGLITLSDYGYAVPFRNCAQMLYENSWHPVGYNVLNCRNNNWIYQSYKKFYLFPYSFNEYNSYYVENGNSENYGRVEYAYSSAGSSYVFSSVYIKADVVIDANNKDGSFEHPYELISS